MFRKLRKHYKFIILVIFFCFIFLIILLPPSIKLLISNVVVEITQLTKSQLIYSKINYKKNIESRKIFEKNKSINIEHYKIDKDIISGSHVLKLKIYDTKFLNLISNKYNASNMQYFDIINTNNILIHYASGEFAIFNYKDNLLKKINSNFCNILEKNTFNVCEDISEYEYGVRDIFLDKDLKLYISSYFSAQENHGCKGLIVFVSEAINSKNNFINLELFYKTPSCVENHNTQSSGGRIQRLNSDYIIISVGDFQQAYTDINKNIEFIYKKNHVAQNYDSHFGKTIIIDNKGRSSVYTIGHRNPQGLHIYDGYIIEAEHGPNGGDEINILTKGGNYGWPYASYGFSYNEDLEMSKSHGNTYEEPILYFSPSIGISEILVYDKVELQRWKNKTLIASLTGNSLFIADIDYENKSVKSIDKIYFGDIKIKNNYRSLNFRIRDIKIDDKGNLFLLIENGYIGYLEKSENDYKGL